MGDMMMPFMIYSSRENTLLYHAVMEYNKSSTIFMTGNEQFLTNSTKNSVIEVNVLPYCLKIMYSSVTRNIIAL